MRTYKNFATARGPTQALPTYVNAKLFNKNFNRNVERFIF